MTLSEQSARHFREIYFGGNWTWSNIKTELSDLSWEEAIAERNGYNSIARLAYHIHYFVRVAMGVLNGGPLIGNDKLSFDHPPIRSAEDWERFLNRCWKEAEEFAALIETLTEEKFFETFTNEKYGSYFRNIHGIIEHAHYHLGQIVILKKLLREKSS